MSRTSIGFVILSLGGMVMLACDNRSALGVGRAGGGTGPSGGGADGNASGGDDRAVSGSAGGSPGFGGGSAGGSNAMILGGASVATGTASGSGAGGMLGAGGTGSTGSGSGDGDNTTGGTTVMGGAAGDLGIGGAPGALTTGRIGGAAGTSGVAGMGGTTVRFTRNTSVANEPVVLDSTTGLTWQGCPAGATGNACNAGVRVAFFWQDAMDYCNALDWGGYQDWSLPSVTTLESIIDYANTNPSIDTTAFPATTSGDFWSSSSSVSDPNSAWALDFNLGNTFAMEKCCLVAICARCVRSGS